jgi:hypothetical protein
MSTVELPTQTCEECEAEFTILHGELDQPSFCPFCACDLGEEEAPEEWDEEWNDEE